MTTPALQRLREKFPQARIGLLTQEKLADLWQCHPSVDDVITFSPGDTVWSVASTIRRFQVCDQKGASFDLGLILPNSPRSALEFWVAGIPRRIGYAKPWRSWMLTERIAVRSGHVTMHKRSRREIKQLVRSEKKEAIKEISAVSHQIYDYLHLTSVLGANSDPVAPHLFISDEEVEACEKRWLADARDKGLTPSGERPVTFLGVNPAAAYGPAKRWPVENFAAVVREVSRRIQDCVWLAVGGKEDAKLCEQIAASGGGHVLNLAGKTSLRELMALLKLCRVLLTNDSGPMHIAAALGTRVVVAFGSTAPELTGPGLTNDSQHYLLKADAPCSPCFRRTCPIDLRCMRGISVPSMVEAVLSSASRTVKR
jgi:heptosyltransferase-2